jgi:hypothetical protein
MIKLEAERSQARHYLFDFRQEDLTLMSWAEDREAISRKHVNYRYRPTIFIPVSIVYVAADRQPTEWYHALLQEAGGPPSRRVVAHKDEHMRACEDEFAVQAEIKDVVRGQAGAIMAGNGFHALPPDLLPGLRTTLCMSPRMVGPQLTELHDYMRNDQMTAEDVVERAVAELEGGRAVFPVDEQELAARPVRVLAQA